MFPVPCCPPGVRVAKGFPSLFFFVWVCVCVWKEFLCVPAVCLLPLLFLPHHLNSHRLYPIETFHFSRPFPFLHSLTVHLFWMRQNMELFHPVRSCTHLFSTSKTQGLCGVMIGFLLCNLLEFSLSHQQGGTMLSYPYTHGDIHAHTHTHTLCRHLHLSLQAHRTTCKMHTVCKL